MSFSPPSSVFSISYTIIQVLVSLVGWKGEIENPTPYSKFFGDTEKGTVPSRIGMLIIYTPALIASIMGLMSSGGDSLYALVAAMLVVHFAKRDLEVLFLHIYSGSTETATAIFIGIFYGITSCVILWSASLAPITYGPHVIVGVFLFVVGVLGNMYHHWLLTTFRNTDGTPKGAAGKTNGLHVPLPHQVSQTAIGLGRHYVVPHGGFFEYVTMPHYFFELIGWFGIFLVVPRLNILLVCTGMFSYLAGRSMATTEWYKQKFSHAWPENRKHLIPFLF